MQQKFELGSGLKNLEQMEMETKVETKIRMGRERTKMNLTAAKTATPKNEAKSCNQERKRSTRFRASKREPSPAKTSHPRISGPEQRQGRRISSTPTDSFIELMEKLDAGGAC